MDSIYDLILQLGQIRANVLTLGHTSWPHSRTSLRPFLAILQISRHTSKAIYHTWYVEVLSNPWHSKYNLFFF